METYTHSCPNCNAVLNPFDWKLPPSPISRDILETNEAPSESQISVIRDLLLKERASLTALDAKIALLQSSLDRLRQERDEFEIKIRKHEGVLSPLRRMPTEILSLIFTFTLRPYHSNAQPAPWTLSAVCARWRITLNAQPGFWTTIRYWGSNFPVRRRERISSGSGEAFRLETQLRRSRELGLHVEFVTLLNSTCTSDDLNIVRILCKHARRWERVSISGSEVHYLEFKNAIQDQLTLLRELTINMAYDHEHVQTLDVFNDAPMLQRVIANKSLWAFPLALVLPWSQLLHYGGSNTWDGHIRALHTAINLVDCSLEIGEIDHLSVPQSPILLPCLLRLSLSHADFLECLETPALLELYCDYADPVLPFLRRQPSKLQKLVMWDCSTPADDDSFTSMVEAIPAIETLVLHFPLPVEFVHDFSSRPNMAPALENFACSLVFDPPTEDAQTHFVQGIELRWASGRLKSVKVHCPAFAPSVLHRLEMLHAEGMEFMVHPNSYSLLRGEIPPELRIETEE